MSEKKAWLVVNGYYTGKSYAYQIARFRKELEKKGIKAFVYENKYPVSDETMFDCDFALFLDKDVCLAMLMEQKGVKVFNASAAIENADNKARTAALLSGAGLRQQKTIFRPKRYAYDRPDAAFLQRVGEELGFPLVAKAACGSLGEQVYLINNERELTAIDATLAENDGLYQAYRKTSVGKSYRVIVIGDEVVGACLLTTENDFRSNAHNGGKGTCVELPECFVDAALKAAKKLGLCYCGVDLFTDEPVVIEVNGNAFFDEFEKQTGINVAKRYVEYVVSKVYD